MAKYNGKYRIGTHRRPKWDYSSNAFYFLTICTQNRVCNLGKIENGEMTLSDFGKIVDQEWHKSFEIRDELILHEYVIMPNHMHTIVQIKNDNVNPNDRLDTNGHQDSNDRLNIHSDMDILSIPIKRNPPPMLPKSISSFMAGFKSAVNTKIDDYIDENNLPIPKYNRNNHFFQPNYNDHIIRDYMEFLRISLYIKSNVQKWDMDSLK